MRPRPERVRLRTRPRPKNFFEAETTMYEPRPDTLEINSVCMSMKTKILAFRT